MVLVKVSPLLKKQKYQEVAVILKEFTKKARSPDDRIYNHAEINFILGNCYALMDKPEKAVGYFKRAVTNDPRHKGAWNNLAISLYQIEKYPEAGDAFLKSYELTRKKEAKLLYLSAVTLLMTEKYDPFLKRFEQLLQVHPEAVTLEWKESYVYGLIHGGKPRKAIPFMIELAREFTGGKQRRWREILLQQYMSLEMYGEARQLLNRLTRQEPTEALWWKGLTHLYLQTADYTKGLAALTIYSFISPLSYEERRLIADLYLQEGIPRKAALHYEKQAEKKPERDILLRLSRSYLELGLPNEALLSLERIEEENVDGEIAMTRGNILYTMKKYDQAAAAFKKAALAKGTSGHKAHLMAGYSYWQQGRYETAKEMFTEAAEGKDVSGSALKAIKQINMIIASRRTAAE